MDRITIDDGIMRMEIAKVEGTASPLIKFHGKGIDAIGIYSMQGRIISRNGRVYMKKHYTNLGHDWDYDGVILPQGIVGVWSSDEIAKGGFWFWKV